MRYNQSKKHTDNYLLNRFKKYNKWNDLVDCSSLEVKCSIILTVIILLVISLFQVYSDFERFIVPIQNVTLYIASALIGMIGIILAGVAIIIGLLDRDIVKKIEELNGEDSVDKILISFEFLAFIIGIEIIIFFLIHIILYSPKSLPPIYIFYTIFAILSYIFIFTIFYTISVISNIVRVFFIKNIYNEAIENSKNLKEDTNEVRIDFILNLLISEKKISREIFLSKLISFVEATNIPNKESVKNYLVKYYSGS